jgi:hypothetical protein
MPAQANSDTNDWLFYVLLQLYGRRKVQGPSSISETSAQNRVLVISTRSFHSHVPPLDCFHIAVVENINL